MVQAEIIVRPNTLARRIGPRARVFTAALVQRAEQALAKVSTLFGDWLQDDIVRADAAIAGLGGAGSRDAAVRCARQLRGSGAAFGFPIISRLAGSLCVLLEGTDPDATGEAAAKLALAHMNAVKAAMRDGLRTDDDPVASAICAELEAQTALLLSRR